MKKDSTVALTKDETHFHPAFSPSGKQIASVQRTSDGTWGVSIFNLKNEKRSFKKFESIIPLEVVFAKENSLILLGQNSLGKRQLFQVNLSGGKLRKLSSGTRNNIFNLRSTDKGLFFEADLNERVQVMRMRSGLSVCTKEPVMAGDPNIIGDYLYYSAEVGDGKVLKKASLKSCRKLSSKEKEQVFPKSFDKDRGMLGLITEARPITVNYKKGKKLKVTPVTETFRGIGPHSWNFFGSRGYQINLLGNNYLGTLGFSATYGVDNDEEVPFGSLGVNYNKYPVVLSVGALIEERNSAPYSSTVDIKWDEKEYGLRLSLPLTWVKGFYNHNLSLGVSSGIIDIGEVGLSRSDQLNNEKLTYYGAEFEWQVSKAMRYQEIYPDYGFRFRGFYRSTEAQREASFGTDLTFLEGSLFLPGLSENHGLRLRASYESQTEGVSNYRHDPINEVFNDYILSRGFDYAYVDSY